MHRVVRQSGASVSIFAIFFLMNLNREAEIHGLNSVQCLIDNSQFSLTAFYKRHTLHVKLARAKLAC